MTNIMHLAIDRLHTMTLDWEANTCPDDVYLLAVITTRDTLPIDHDLHRILTDWVDEPFLLTDTLESFMIDNPFNY